jgi:hypothetical protein
MKILGLFTALLLAFFMVSTGQSTNRARGQQLGDGVWGGNHIQMTVENAQALIDFDCAEAVINGPLNIGSNGRFTFTGTFTKGSGGPVRKDSKPKEKPARFTGQVRGNTMTLTVTVDDVPGANGTYILTRGRNGRIFRCY